MRARGKWSDDEDETLLALHREGFALRRIAETMGRSAETVGRHARRLGLSFDRTRTSRAAEARHVDNRARRAALESRLLDEAEKSLDRLWKPMQVYAFAGAEGDFHSTEIDEPSPVDRKAIMQTAQVALTASSKLHEMNAGRDAETLGSQLGKLIDSLESG